MPDRRFRQVDVFSAQAFAGNPVAVILDAEGLDESTMVAIARWMNLSETTFVVPPSSPEADYALRIFSPTGELSFAGHPTLGSAHAWLEAGGQPRHEDRVVQECGIGLVDIARDGDTVAFRSPPLLRYGAVDSVTLVRSVAALGIAVTDVVHASWIDNGPGWIGLVLPSAAAVLAIRPDFVAMDDLRIGVLGPHEAGGPADYEVRAFAPALTVGEDPVTGSLNAGFASWLIEAGLAPQNYLVRQGTMLGRNGRVVVTTDTSGAVWIGGHCTTRISGGIHA